jgi:hypothetical protein
MELTPDNKRYIDQLSHYELLERLRRAPIGDPWFLDETGVYWVQRRRELADADHSAAVADSKAIGW